MSALLHAYALRAEVLGSFALDQGAGFCFDRIIVAGETMGAALVKMPSQVAGRRRKRPQPGKRLALIFAAHLLAVASALASQREPSTEAYLARLEREGKERVIVQFKEDSPVDAGLVGRHGGRLIRQFSSIRGLVCEMPKGKLDALRKERGVKDVSPDAIVRADPGRRVQAAEAEAREPAGERSPKSYTGPVTVRWNNLEAGINSKAAWNNYGLDGSGVKIAFLDTGVNYNLTNLHGSYLGGTDFVEGDGDPLTTNSDEHHGTEVVSVAVGRGVEGGKVVGVAFRAGFYAVRVLDSAGSGFISDVIAGLQWASAEPHKADVMSMSLGAYGQLPGVREAFNLACNNAYNAGIVLVASSGNEGYTYSADPATFTNVISVGSHTEAQTIWNDSHGASNGGAEIVAPGAEVHSVDPGNELWQLWGTSYATPHAAALIALQIQYARQQGIEPNNGYVWEVMKHSAKDMPLITDPVFRGNGKIWAAETDPPPAAPADGSIDAMARHWPLAFGLSYSNAAYFHNSQPVYDLGSNLTYGLTLTNYTSTAGNYTNAIENLDVTIMQAYYQRSGETNLPGSSVELFPRAYVPPEAMGPDATLDLADDYAIPTELEPGTNRLALTLAFEFAADPNHRLIQVTYPYAGLWLAAPATNQPPVAFDQALTNLAEAPTPITLAGTDPDGDALGYQVIAPPLHGTLSGTGSNLVYASNNNWYGPDAFSFVADDGWTNSAAATVTLTVLPFNRQPIITAFQSDGTNWALEAQVQPGRTTLPQRLGALGESWEDLATLAQTAPMATNLMVPASFLLSAETNGSGFYRLRSQLP